MTFNKTILSTSDRYTVSELNKASKDLLSTYFSIIQVEGEISNLSTPSSGHIYFSLKDKKAQIRCAMFKSQQRHLSFKPENGQHVLISAQVSLYEARGDYQLIIDKMQPDGEGDLQKAFDQLKTKLLNEGLFAAEKKQSLPKIPQQIGLITSPTGAAVHDVLTVLKKRFPSIPIIIYPSAVQGEHAKFEIINAIKTANQEKKVDLIILARGGGSVEDLWAFNEESVARAIAQSKMPIITGIGHEVDFTIADFIADLRAPTPSAAAENAVPDQQSWLNKFHVIEIQLQQIIQRHIIQARQSSNWLRKRLQQQHPGQQLQKHEQALDHLELRLTRAINTKLNAHKEKIKHQSSLLFRQYNPIDKISRYQEQLHYYNNRLKTAIYHKLETSQSSYRNLAHTLNAVSPLATLERGYAIVTASDSSVITSSYQVSVKDTLKIRLNQGHIISQVTKINHE